MAATPVPTLESESVPLAVWPCAQTSAQYQRAGRYVPASSRHPGKMLPELVRRMVTEYSQPGGLVVHPMCGIGTTLVEGAALGRRCVGVELEARWADLGHGRGDAYLTGMAEVYAACFAVLRPGGLLVTVTKNMRRRGQPIDLAAATRRLAAGAGFDYLQHVVALAGLRDEGLVGRPSFWPLTHTRRARAKVDPLHLVVHEDVLMFAKPQEPADG